MPQNKSANRIETRASFHDIDTLASDSDLDQEAAVKRTIKSGSTEF
jgi:hypothetical protein